MKNWTVKTRDKQKGIVLREIDRELHELPASAYGSVTQHDHDDKPISVELQEERFLPFNAPAGRVAAKRLYTVKAEKADGAVIQIPLEDQINNNIASPQNAIGLQGYARRGVNVWFDFETGEAAFCPTWDCWAQWNQKYDGFCSPEHKEITKGDDSGERNTFGGAATTSRGWG